MTTAGHAAIQLPTLQSPRRLDGIDHVEMYVGNAYQAAHLLPRG